MNILSKFNILLTYFTKSDPISKDQTVSVAKCSSAVEGNDSCRDQKGRFRVRNKKRQQINNDPQQFLVRHKKSAGRRKGSKSRSQVLLLSDSYKLKQLKQQYQQRVPTQNPFQQKTKLHFIGTDMNIIQAEKQNDHNLSFCSQNNLSLRSQTPFRQSGFLSPAFQSPMVNAPNDSFSLCSVLPLPVPVDDDQILKDDLHFDQILEDLLRE